MRITARWTWGLIVALSTAFAAIGCNNAGGGTGGNGGNGGGGGTGGDGGGTGGAIEPGPCPIDDGVEEECVWEGGVRFVPATVVQADGLVYVTGEMKWEPCSMIPGLQTRTYRIDPADGATARMEAPAGAEPVSMEGEGPIEVVPEGASHLVRIARDSMESVSEVQLTIGEIVDEATGGVVAQIEVASVCEE